MKIFRKRNNTPARANRTALLDVIQVIARDRSKWRKLALKRLYTITTKKNEIYELEMAIKDLLKANEYLEKENTRLNELAEKSLNNVFDWDNLTYHQREQVHYFADVVKGYINDERFSRINTH